MEENQRAEQTLQFATWSAGLQATLQFYENTILQTAENICFVETTRQLEATKGSSKHAGQKFATFKC